MISKFVQLNEILKGSVKTTPSKQDTVNGSDMSSVVNDEIPLEIESVLASDTTNKFLLRWNETTSVPGLVYRLVVNRDLDVDEEGCLKDELKGRKDNVSLEWIM